MKIKRSAQAIWVEMKAHRGKAINNTYKMSLAIHVACDSWICQPQRLSIS